MVTAVSLSSALPHKSGKDLMRRFIVLASAVAIGISGCSTASGSLEDEVNLLPIVRMANPDVNGNVTGRDAAGSVLDFAGRDGYTFDVRFTIAAGLPSSSLTNAAPGTSDISWEVGIGIVATNTTADRNSDWSYLQDLSVVGLWPADSPLCSAGNRNTPDEGKYPWRVVQGLGGADYCQGVVRTLSGLTDPFGVADSRSLTADRPFAITVSEQDQPGVLAAMESGPTAWLVLNETPGFVGACDIAAVVWVSNVSLGCSPPSTTIAAVSSSAIDVQPAVKTIEEIASSAGTDLFPALSSCPFSESSLGLVPGLMPDSLQSLAWSDLYFDNSITDGVFAGTVGLTCRDGGMTVEARTLASAEGAEVFLANDPEAEWVEISNAVDLYGGQAFVSADRIVPEGGEAYEIVRFAWSSGDLLLSGKIVRGTPEGTMRWLAYSIPILVSNVGSWTGEVVG